jgi:L-fucose isomerase-like protein
MKNTVGFVCFGEVNTPIERLNMKHDEALAALREKVENVVDGGLVIDDPAYETADAAYAKIAGLDLDCLVVCVAGWVPTHAVIRVTDHFRHVPMILWGLCGWKENGRIITTAEQAGTTALRPAFEALEYTFKYVYNIIGKPWPMEKITSYIAACRARKNLRSARVGTMGYRDMLLYGTQYEGNSMRGRIGVEVEPYEMLEMVRAIDTLDAEAIAEGVNFVKENWVFKKACDDSVIEKGVKYALAITKKIRERGWEAITLIDVDGMKKLEGFPPAMVFMLLERYCNILTVPENDVMGAVTQLIMKYITGQTVPYLEYYEFFENSMLIGVPDFVPKSVTDGDVTVLPAAFGLLNASLLNVSKVKTGYVTCARLVYLKGKYKMHVYTAEAKEPPAWNEYGWDDPAPQLPSLEVFPDSCTVEEFAQNVSSQHVIVAYGNHVQALRDFCGMMDIELVM